MGPVQLLDSMLNDAFSGRHSGWHTEDLADRYGIDRESQDAWAADRALPWRWSGKRASAARGFRAGSRGGSLRDLIP